MTKKATKNENTTSLEKEEYIPDTEPDQEDSLPKPIKPKKKMTPEALERLAKAREKALQAKRENKELRDLEKQADKKAKEDLKEQRKQELKKILRPEDIEQPDEPTSKREDIKSSKIKKEQQLKPESEYFQEKQPKPKPKPEPEPEQEEYSLPRTKTVPNFDFFAKEEDESPFEEIGGFLVLKEPYRKRR